MPPCATSPRSPGARPWAPTTSPPPRPPSRRWARGCSRPSTRAAPARPSRRARRARGTACGRCSARPARTPVGVVVGARNLWGDRQLAPDVVRRFVLCAVDSGVSRVRATDPLNDPDAPTSPWRAPARRPAAEFVPTLIVGPRARTPTTRAGSRRPSRSRRSRAPPRCACPTAPGTSRPRPSARLVSAVARGDRAAGRGPGAGARRPGAAVGHRRRPRRGGLGAGVRGAGRAGVGPPLGRDAARRPGGRRAPPRLPAHGPRPRRPRGRPDAAGRPPAPGRRGRVRPRRRRAAGARGRA